MRYAEATTDRLVHRGVRAGANRAFALATGWLALAAACLTLAPAPVEAQYFGRNKVQYEDFDFRVLHTDHFDIYHYPEEAAAVRDAARMAERWYARLSDALDHEFRRPNPVILYANHADFQQTTVIRGLIGEGTGGVTEALKNRVVLPLTGSYAETDHVLGHELVHAFQYDLARTGGIGISNLGRLPLWMVEGLAEYLSVGRVDAHTAMWLRDALLHDRLPTLDDLAGDPHYFPYRWGQAFWAYVGGRWDDGVIAELFRAAAANGIDAALDTILGTSDKALSRAWMASIRAAYAPTLEGRVAPARVGTTLITEESGGGQMNIAPAVSPDGRYVAFFSERDLFSIDLYLADARSGEIIEKLTTTASNSHFDALNFLESAGTWSPDGRRFAFVVFEDGDNALVIIEVPSGDVLREVHVPGIGAMSNPEWSPDGRRIAFSGMEGGISDLYIYDLRSNTVRRLTNDRYADLQPAWSPDGGTLAFVTDRGPRTDFDALRFAPMRLALLDLETGRVRTLDVFEGAKHIDPSFSPDGESLYFISNPDGFSDIYRLALGSGRVFRVTRIATGVSGVTELSPALSVAARTGRLLFTVFSNTNHEIHALPPARAGGEPVERMVAGIAPAAVLPPSDRLAGSVFDYLHDPLEGLPRDTRQFTISDYDPDLALDYLGAPTIGVSVSEFGTNIGGGTAAFFSDMLGHHSLVVGAQAGGELEDLGAQLSYENRDDRWNWGLDAGRVPIVTGAAGVERVPVEINGQTVSGTRISQLRNRIYFDRVAYTAAYPFSTTHRFEVMAGYTHLGFDSEVNRILAVNGQIVRREERELEAPEGLHLFQPALAFVGDNSFFGFTSPVRGGRYRFQYEPTFGTVRYQAVLADYRRYLFWRPLTLAFRGLHYGRYGQDADSDRLRPLFLGNPAFVRGYGIGSFDPSECMISAGNGDGCPEFDRLVGSRIAVTKFELRLPLFGTESFGLLTLPYLPTELVAFLDAGAAWTGDDDLSFDFSRRTAERTPVVSAGVAARFNVLGYLVAQVFYAYPFQRPDEGWQFGFLLSPGF